MDFLIKLFLFKNIVYPDKLERRFTLSEEVRDMPSDQCNADNICNNTGNIGTF